MIAVIKKNLINFNLIHEKIRKQVLTTICNTESFSSKTSNPRANALNDQLMFMFVLRIIHIKSIIKDV